MESVSPLGEAHFDVAIDPPLGDPHHPGKPPSGECSGRPRRLRGGARRLGSRSQRPGARPGASRGRPDRAQQHVAQRVDALAADWRTEQSFLVASRRSATRAQLSAVTAPNVRPCSRTGTWPSRVQQRCWRARPAGSTTGSAPSSKPRSSAVRTRDRVLADRCSDGRRLRLTDQVRAAEAAWSAEQARLATVVRTSSTEGRSSTASASGSVREVGKPSCAPCPATPASRSTGRPGPRRSPRRGVVGEHRRSSWSTAQHSPGTPPRPVTSSGTRSRTSTRVGSPPRTDSRGASSAAGCPARSAPRPGEGSRLRGASVRSLVDPLHLRLRRRRQAGLGGRNDRRLPALRV